MYFLEFHEHGSARVSAYIFQLFTANQKCAPALPTEEKKNASTFSYAQTPWPILKWFWVVLLGFVTWGGNFVETCQPSPPAPASCSLKLNIKVKTSCAHKLFLSFLMGSQFQKKKGGKVYSACCWYAFMPYLFSQNETNVLEVMFWISDVKGKWLDVRNEIRNTSDVHVIIYTKHITRGSCYSDNTLEKQKGVRHRERHDGTQHTRDYTTHWVWDMPDQSLIAHLKFWHY